jgi:hypothetical protein
LLPEEVDGPMQLVNLVLQRLDRCWRRWWRRWFRRCYRRCMPHCCRRSFWRRRRRPVVKGCPWLRSGKTEHQLIWIHVLCKSLPPSMELFLPLLVYLCGGHDIAIIRQAFQMFGRNNVVGVQVSSIRANAANEHLCTRVPSVGLVRKRVASRRHIWWWRNLARVGRHRCRLQERRRHCQSHADDKRSSFLGGAGAHNLSQNGYGKCTGYLKAVWPLAGNCWAGQKMVTKSTLT